MIFGLANPVDGVAHCGDEGVGAGGLVADQCTPGHPSRVQPPVLQGGWAVVGKDQHGAREVEGFQEFGYRSEGHLRVHGTRLPGRQRGRGAAGGDEVDVFHGEARFLKH